MFEGKNKSRKNLIVDSILPMNFISAVLILNGIYDIICSFAILSKKTFFQDLHLGIFMDHMSTNERAKRMMAYYIASYGLIRLFSGLYPSPITYMISAVTYYTEAIVFQYEGLIEPVDPFRLNFITGSSVIIGSALLFYGRRFHNLH